MSLTVAMTRPISIFLLVVGLLWGLIVTGLIALFGGFFGNNPPHDPVLIAKGLLPIWWVFIGPLLLVGGAICTLKGVFPRLSAVAVLVGCIVLTVMVGNDVVHALQNSANPLVGKQPYTFDVVMVVAALLADAGAVQLYRLAGRPSGMA